MVLKFLIARLVLLASGAIAVSLLCTNPKEHGVYRFFVL
jgi:hypothetical protein